MTGKDTGISDTAPTSDSSTPDSGLTTDTDGVEGKDGGGTICGDTSCGPNQECIDQQCVPVGENKCEQVEHIGSIAAGGSISIEDGFGAEQDDTLQNACTGTDDTPEKVYQFDVESGVQITPRIDTGGEFSATVEFRQECATRNDETDVCSTGTRSLYAESGSNWYVVVEKDAGVPGDFTVTLEASQACSFGPPGASTCRDGDRVVCQEGATEQKFDCPAGCIDEECHGYSCENPIMIDGVEDGQTYSGDISAYDPNINFANGDDSCQVNDVAADSEGSEVYFRVQAEKDDEIVVDTSGDSWDNLVYITNSCTDVATGMYCHTTWEAEAEQTWTVPQPGTYWVIVDKRYVGSGDPNNPDGMFEYTVNVR